VSFQQEMTDAVQRLHNVTNFSVECLDTPNPKDMVPLFIAAWDTFGPRLETLTLAIDNLRTIFTTSFFSKCLKELKIEFTPGEYPEDDDTLAAVLTPFINKHAASLQTLSFASSDNLRDLGPLFRSLGRYPMLRKLDISVDFHKCGLSDPRGLTRLLVEHNDTLRSVILRPTLSRGNHWEIAEASLVEWMSENASNKRFLSDVQSLDLRMPMAPSHLNMTVSYIHRSAATLTSLSLLDHSLRYEQIEAVVKVLSSVGRLKTLTLQVLTLSPQLVDLMAKKLPFLEVLNLVVLNINGCDESLGQQSGEDIEHEAVGKFHAILHKLLTFKLIDRYHLKKKCENTCTPIGSFMILGSSELCNNHAFQQFWRHPCRRFEVFWNHIKTLSFRD
jgi:hypothetical protein